MEVERLQSKLSLLFAETAERLNQEVLGMQRQILQVLKQLDEQSSALIQQLVKQARHSAEQEDSIEVPQVSETLLPGSFGAWLLEPSLPICVSGEELHVHASVLRKIPYFEGLLRGTWRDSANPQVDLPCSTSEFCLLLQRIYTGEVLGTPALPVKDGATAVRLAVSAARLLIDTSIPELPTVLRGSIVTDEDCKLALAAASALPGSLSEILNSLGTLDIPKGDLQAMIESAKTPDTQAAARQVLAKQHGEAKNAAVLAAARGLLESLQSVPNVDWATDIAQEHLECHEVTEVFKAVPRKWPSCSRCPQPRTDPSGIHKRVHEAFLLHLRRCAQRGCAVEALCVGFEKPPQVSRSRCANGHRTLIVWRGSSLAFDGSSRAGLAAALNASCSELSSLAECLSQMPVTQLAEVLGEEVLQALAQYVEAPIAALAASSVDAKRWVTAERLEVLPRSAQLVMARALLPVLGGVPQGVAAKIAGLLA